MTGKRFAKPGASTRQATTSSAHGVPAIAHHGAPMISLRGVTKDYGHERGVFDLTLDVTPGEAVGFLGANGAGKTVTMRTLMGFIKPGSGTATIGGLDCFRDRARIQAAVGYLPGEVSCPEDLRGQAFISYVAHMKGLGQGARQSIDDLMARFELDASARIGQMSKGTKQKVAIVAAFMGNPQVLLLDEPTSGLDPVMQDRFVSLVRERKRAGATILLSSHMFPEVERVCDRVALIRAGRLQDVRSMDELRDARHHLFSITFPDGTEAMRYLQAPHASCRVTHAGSTGTDTASSELSVEVTGSVDAFVKDLAAYRVTGLTSKEQTLEELFRHVYEGDGNGTDAGDEGSTWGANPFDGDDATARASRPSRTPRFTRPKPDTEVRA